MKNIALVIFLFSFAMLAVLFANLYLFYEGPFKIQNHIQILDTNIKISGVFLFIFIFLFLRTAEELFIKIVPEATIGKLTLWAALIVFIPETIFQLFRWLMDYDDTKKILINVFLLTPIVYGILAFLIAYWLKTRKINQLIWMIIISILLIDGIYLVVKGISVKQFLKL